MKVKLIRRCEYDIAKKSPNFNDRVSSIFMKNLGTPKLA